MSTLRFRQRWQEQKGAGRAGLLQGGLGKDRSAFVVVGCDVAQHCGDKRESRTADKEASAERCLILRLRTLNRCGTRHARSAASVRAELLGANRSQQQSAFFFR